MNSIKKPIFKLHIMKNILKLTFILILIISCKSQNIIGTGVNNRFVGTWVGTVEEEEPSVPIPQQVQDDTTENDTTENDTTGTREIIVNIKNDGSITIDDNVIPVSSIYEDIIENNDVYQYTISYIAFNSEKKSTTMFNYMIIFEDNVKATIEGVTIITIEEKQQRLKVPQTTINKQT